MDSPNIGVIEARLSSVERDLARQTGRFDEKLNSVSDQISQKGKPEWGILASFAGLLITVVGALGGLALLPVYNKLSEHDSIVEKIRTENVPRPEIAEKVLAIYRDIDNLRSRLILTTDALQKQIDDNRRDYKSIYGAPDAFKEINDRLKRVEEMSWKATIVDKPSGQRN